MRAIDLGAGRTRHVAGAVTLDRVASTGPDIVHDMDVVPWPIADSSFDVIRCYDVLEHVGDLVPVMREIHRIGAPGARVEITTPHYSSRNSWTDPTHRQHLAYRSFDYFIEGHELSFYSDARFIMRERRIRCRNTLKGRVVEQVANRWPAMYEEHLAWMLPAFYLWFVLEVRKA
ncbi:MAG TPA: methyltransferase domain-containing protein [Vicinamibacterales bacterium]|nr:methyltransferase domain-containing protein [Vicinamibacterales bacterium]